MKCTKNVRFFSKSPAKSPVQEAKKTPAKSPAKSPAKKDDNVIELKKDSNGLGISIVGGSDTPLVSVLREFSVKTQFHEFFFLRFREESSFTKFTKTGLQRKMVEFNRVILSSQSTERLSKNVPIKRHCNLYDSRKIELKSSLTADKTKLIYIKTLKLN